jgi:hypothetical protein
MKQKTSEVKTMSFNWDLINHEYNKPFEFSISNHHSDIKDKVKFDFDYEFLFDLSDKEIKKINNLIKQKKSKNEIIKKICDLHNKK